MKLKTFGTMKSYFCRHQNISKKIKHFKKLPNKETNNFQCKYFHVHTARRFFVTANQKNINHNKKNIKEVIRRLFDGAKIEVKETANSITKVKESVSEFGEYFFRVLVFASIAYIFTEHVAYVTLVMGPSMLDTFHVVGDLLIVEAISPIFRDYHVGDVVVAKSPTKPGQYVVKRVRAVAGDVVHIPKIRCSKRGPFEEYIIPHGHVWLQGDNPRNSSDSRDYGPIPITLLKYRAFCRIYPNPFVIEHIENETLPGTAHHFKDLIKV